MKKYTHFLVIGFLCLFSSSSFSQAQFEIVNLGNNYSAPQLETTLNNFIVNSQHKTEVKVIKIFF